MLVHRTVGLANFNELLQLANFKSFNHLQINRAICMKIFWTKLGYEQKRAAFLQG